MAPPSMINVAAADQDRDSADSQGLVSTGQLSTLLPSSSDVVNVLESMKRISDAKYPQVVRPTSTRPRMPRDASPGLRYTKAAYLLNRIRAPRRSIRISIPTIVGPSGIFTTAEYQGSKRLSEDRGRHETRDQRRCGRRHDRDGRLRLP
jgi:hypothetical protein